MLSADQSKVAAGAVRIQLSGENMQLHPLKAMYWEDERVLLIADLHLGKATHFRRAGIRVPLGVSHTNFDRLINLLLEYRPLRVMLLGDLFHSEYNTAWEEIGQLIGQFKDIKFQLVPGNHDILSAQYYQEAGLQVLLTHWHEGPFLFSHFPLQQAEPNAYNLAGHVHPAVRLYGNGKQVIKLPCFYFGDFGGILPAFGAFTGSAVVSAQINDHVFVITETEVLAV